MLTQDAKRVGIHKSQNTPAAKKARKKLADAEKILTDALVAEENCKAALAVGQQALDAATADMEIEEVEALQKSVDSASDILTKASTTVNEAAEKVSNLKK